MDASRADIKAHTGKMGFWAFFAALLFSPGFSTLLLHRMASAAYHWGGIGKVLGKAIWRLNILCSACHISLSAKIEGGVCLPHPVGIVIGAGTIIKKNVTIYQNTTLGTSDTNESKYPTIEEDVVIYAGSVIIGDIIIGKAATIGANSFVSNSISAGAVAVGAPARERKVVNPIS